MEILESIGSAIRWLFEGFLGCLSAAAYAHTDVPTLQCLIGGLSVAGLGLSLDLFAHSIYKKIKRRRQEKSTARHEQEE